MKIYMAVTNDKYEFPLLMTDTLKELSVLTGAPNNYICKCIKHNIACYKYDKEKGIKFTRVELDR